VVTASAVPEIDTVLVLIWLRLVFFVVAVNSGSGASSPSIAALSSSGSARASSCHSCSVAFILVRPMLDMKGVSVGEMS